MVSTLEQLLEQLDWTLIGWFHKMDQVIRSRCRNPATSVYQNLRINTTYIYRINPRYI
jgi:succinate dehydrogenase flavin-adding protein (antitoxin of CptAB toxin-antitoxin module)